jgi:hypothetical protein
MTGRRSPLLVATVVTFTLGVVLMIPFEATITRILGVAFLFAGIVCGVALIANPADLAQDAEGDQSAE